MKRIDLFFTALLVPLDYLALLLAATAAYGLRYSSYFIDLRAVTFDLPYSEFMLSISWLALVWIGIFGLLGLYSVRPPALAKELSRIVYAICAAAAILLAIAFFSRELFDSRFIFLAGWIFSIIFVSISRLVVRVVQRTLRKAGIGVQHVIAIGENEQSRILHDYFDSFPRFGYKIVHRIGSLDNSTQRTLLQLRRAHGASTLLITDPTLRREDIESLHTFAENEHFTFLHSASLFPSAAVRPIIHIFAGLPIIEVPKTPLDGWGAIYKRAFDIVFSLIGLIIATPIMLIAGLLLAIEDGFPVIFANERIGRNGKTFLLYKLRSFWRKYSIGPQFKDAEADNLKLEEKLIEERSERTGPVYKVTNDPRVTPLGRIFRKLSIDELPQLWNVLLGNMSLVGPRPHQPREVDQYEPHQRRVLAIKPGITGIAQISGRADLSFEDEVQLDLYYIEHWSPLFDLIILIKTPIAVLFSRGAM